MKEEADVPEDRDVVTTDEDVKVVHEDPGVDAPGEDVEVKVEVEDVHEDRGIDTIAEGMKVDDHMGDDPAKIGEEAEEDDDSGDPLVDSVESLVTSPASSEHPQGPVAEETEI